MLIEIAEHYRVVRGKIKANERDYIIGDILPSDGLPRRNIESMVNLGWIVPVDAIAGETEDPDRPKRGRPPKAAIG